MTLTRKSDHDFLPWSRKGEVLIPNSKDILIILVMYGCTNYCECKPNPRGSTVEGIDVE